MIFLLVDDFTLRASCLPGPVNSAVENVYSRADVSQLVCCVLEALVVVHVARTVAEKGSVALVTPVRCG